MFTEDEKYINDLITECFKSGDRYVDIFAKQEMTLADAQLLVEYTLKKQCASVGEEIQNFMADITSQVDARRGWLMQLNTKNFTIL